MEGKRQRGQIYGRDRGKHAREEREKKEGERDGEGRGRVKGREGEGERKRGGEKEWGKLWSSLL
jgi:hypothetical protein